MIIPKPGEQWKENDPRFVRIVTIKAVEGDTVIIEFKGRVTKASLKRFNGKSKGYSRFTDGEKR